MALSSLCSIDKRFYTQHLLLPLTLEAERMLFDPLKEEGEQRQRRG